VRRNGLAFLYGLHAHPASAGPDQRSGPPVDPPLSVGEGLEVRDNKTAGQPGALGIVEKTDVCHCGHNGHFLLVLVVSGVA
jgi:hypothetical protein